MSKKKLTKNRKKFLSKIYKKNFSLEESLSIIKQIGFAKFDESVDISIRLCKNNKIGNNNIKGIVDLPHGTGKKNCILAIVTEDKKNESKKVGATYVGLDYIDKINSGWWDNKINSVISMPSIMNKLNMISKILGRKGLMPNNKYNTISSDPEISIKNIISGRVFFKSDKYGIIHSSIGRKSFSNNFLLENIMVFVKEFIKKNYNYHIKNIYLSTTMSYSILLDQKVFLNERK
ncbi:50S ribosomal protein L1 [Blattabacterium cuenoti]|uniref:50S ribosomal protein L1 n=1 Tax=Blattabacterium cuenoti TaxID=1653831 RepID=UPI00163BD88B|nr:50S ribosomal protein L1 [Blattabacterium cuenoti]